MITSNRSSVRVEIDVVSDASEAVRVSVTEILTRLENLATYIEAKGEASRVEWFVETKITNRADVEPF